MNREPEIRDFLLNIDDETYKFTVQFSSNNEDDTTCNDCAIKTFCDKCDVFAKQEISGSWVSSDGAICTCSKTTNNTIIYDFRKEAVQKSDKFIIYSVQDIRIQREKSYKDYDDDEEEDKTITPLSIINSFCLSGFCPIRTSTMDCIRSIECPFREIFKETGVGILYLPEK